MSKNKKAATGAFHWLIILSFLGVLSWLTPRGYAQTVHILSDSEYALCKAKLKRAHQGFYQLSYSEQYVRDVIMPGIRTERPKIAPHFPQRTAGKSSDALFKTWIEMYRNEYDAYMHYLQKQHEKWRLALSEH